MIFVLAPPAHGLLSRAYGRGMTALRNVRILDPSDACLGDPVDVVFDALITEIRPAEDGPVGPEEIDGAGRALVPGLIDTHVHLGELQAMVEAARAGITTVVDLGTTPDSLIHEQKAAEGIPSILSAGAAACAPGGSQIVRMGFPESGGVDSPEDAARYLELRVEAGSDLIKIIIEDPEATDVPALEIPTITALVDGAHERGLLAVAHVVTAGAFERGLEAGVDILTHAPLDRVLPEATIARMVEQGTVSSPTLAMMRNIAQRFTPETAQEGLGHAQDSVRQMHRAGVAIIAGTDANQTPMAPLAHGASLHDELELLREAGLSAPEVLAAATVEAAARLRLQDRARIAQGKRADLLLVDGDPLKDLGVLRSPDAVWIAGMPAR